MSPNLKLQTGWGRNLSLEHRKFTSPMRVQSHRRYSRPEVAAPVCAILTMRIKIARPALPLYARFHAPTRRYRAAWMTFRSTRRERPDCGRVIRTTEAQDG